MISWICFCYFLRACFEGFWYSPGQSVPQRHQDQSLAPVRSASLILLLLLLSSSFPSSSPLLPPLLPPPLPPALPLPSPRPPLPLLLLVLIPLLMSSLNCLFRFKTLIAKAIGVMCSVAGGLAAGKEVLHSFSISLDFFLKIYI